MKTIKTNIYEFKELSEDAKENALNNLRDLNVYYDWWNTTYEDAKNIGLKITYFGLDRNRHAEGEFLLNAYEVAHKIKENHGKHCETYKTAASFIEDWDKLVSEYQQQIDNGDTQDFDEKANEMEEDFLKSLLEDYSMMLQKESEYLQSDTSIIETIEANGYTFEEDGTMRNE